jgi:hypothetical protein
MLRAVDAWHSPVTEAELLATCCLLDPSHSRTRRIIEQIVGIVERRPVQRTIAPDCEVWRDGAQCLAY